MLRVKPFFKVKSVLEYVATLKILAYLGTEPVSRFMSEIEKLTENIISVVLPTLETITNCRNCIIDVFQRYICQDWDLNIQWCYKHYILNIV